MFATFTKLTSRQLSASFTLTCEFGVALPFTTCMCTSTFTLKWTWKQTNVNFYVSFVWIQVNAKVNGRLLSRSLSGLLPRSLSRLLSRSLIVARQFEYMLCLSIYRAVILNKFHFLTKRFIIYIDSKLIIYFVCFFSVN